MWPARTGCIAAWTAMLEHKQELFVFCDQRWEELFDGRFDVLLYDLTSTYFEGAAASENPQSQAHGYSRDRPARLRPGGDRTGGDAGRLPAGLRGAGRQHHDNTTLARSSIRSRRQYGKARRVWVMDRGIPTEATLAEMREPGRETLAGGHAEGPHQQA